MDRALFLFALLCSVVVPKVYAVDFTRVMSNVPTVEFGSIERYSVCMTGESIPFIIDIWLPEGYDAGSRYPVVYMADGQNLFDKNHSLPVLHGKWSRKSRNWLPAARFRDLP